MCHKGRLLGGVMKRLLAVSLFISVTVSGQTPVLAGPFQSYPVSTVFNGPVHMPDFNGRDRKFSDFRTRIRDGIKAGPNFAGRYAIISWGCGTECVDYVVADVATGEVFDFPLGGENYGELQLDTKIYSRLVVANWTVLTDRRAPDNGLLVQCLRQSFVWNGNAAIALRKPVIIATVKWGDEDSCNGR